jgi:hypothetical protein
MLPPVQILCRSLAGHDVSFPGTSILNNLAEGRKSKIETGQEGSEVLWVGEDTVLHRVNDTIYQARLANGQTKDASILVKDEDVPEVHWVF